MVDIGMQNSPERAKRATVPEGQRDIFIFGAPVSDMRYALAVCSVLAVVSVLFLSLAYY